jgi:predicted permease
MLDLFRWDVRHAVRGLLRDRGFTFVAVLSIALGVGANSSIFSLADQAMFRLLPVREPERLVLLDWNGRFVGPGWGSGNLLPHPLYRELAAENQVFKGMFARHPTQVHLAAGGVPEPVNAEIVSGSYFAVLGVQPALGRLLDESDDVQPGAHPVVVVSFGYWKTRLGGARDAVGRKVLVNGHAMTVVGVTPAAFRGIDWAETPALWIPIMMKRQATPSWDWLQYRRGRWLHVFGRLKPGIGIDEARAGLQPWFKAMLDADTRREGWPRVTDDDRRQFLASTLDVLPASHGRSDLRDRMERPLVVLLSATALVLLLACLNVANLALARALQSKKEIALRTALGAARGRILREQLVQSAVVALAGGAVGILLAPYVTEVLIRFIPGSGDVALSSEIDRRVLLFTLAVSASTGLLFGLIPALHASRTDPSFTLKEDSSTVARGIGVRRLLVVGQIALALILLVGAGLFVRTLSGLRAQGPGFATTNLLMFRLDPTLVGNSSERSKNVVRDTLERIRALPEVESAALSAGALLAGGSWNQPLTVMTDKRLVTGTIHCNVVSPGFFDTLGAQVVRGRNFDEREAGESLPTEISTGQAIPFRTAIINESFARRHFGDRDPIGARLGLGSQPDTHTDIEIVGVVRTFHYRGLRATEDQAYFPQFTDQWSSATFYVRTRAAAAGAFASLRAVARETAPGIPITSLRTLDDQIDRSLMTERMLATLATAFAALAIVLAVVGLHGVLSFVVARRSREIGIRLALGASPAEAVRLILRDAAAMTAAGVAIALPVVWALGRSLESQLFGVRPMDPVTLLAATCLVAFVALSSSAVPAWRASSVDPANALRSE